VTERQVRWLFIVLVVVQFMLLSAQVPSVGGGNSSLEAALLLAVAPVTTVVSWLGDLTVSAGQGLSLRRALLEDNERLRSEVESLKRQTIEGFGLEQEVQRLSMALEYSRTRGTGLQVADIVFVDHASWLQTIVLAVEEGKAVHNQPVVSSRGLVGRVVVESGRYAKVQLVTDRSASVGVMIERSRRQGLVRGAGGGELELDFVPLQSEVLVGDRVVTAGIDGVFPRGIPVGTITEVEPGSELFHKIRLVPAVDFGHLDQVYLLQGVNVPEDIKSDLPDARP